MTVAGAAEKWLAVVVPTRRNASGVRDAKARVRKYLTPALGWKLVEKVTGDDMRSYRLWLEGRDIKPQTVAHVLSDARAMFNWLADAGYIGRSPIPRRLLPRIPERAPDRLTDKEADRLAGLPDPHGFVVRLALSTGLRWGELCRVQSSDIENGMLVVSRTKSGKVRRVPLCPEILREIRGRVGRLVPFSPTSKGSFNVAVRRLSRDPDDKNGVERFHVHQCRHTFACQWLERGGTLEALQEILGHASITTTQRYARLGERAVRAEAERLFARER